MGRGVDKYYDYILLIYEILKDLEQEVVNRHLSSEECVPLSQRICVGLRAPTLGSLEPPVNPAPAEQMLLCSVGPGNRWGCFLFVHLGFRGHHLDAEQRHVSFFHAVI